MMPLSLPSKLHLLGPSLGDSPTAALLSGQHYLSETYNMTCFYDCIHWVKAESLPLRSQGQMENKVLFLRLKGRPSSIILQGRTDFISFFWSCLVGLGKGLLVPPGYVVFWQLLQRLLKPFFASLAFAPPGTPGGGKGIGKDFVIFCRAGL